MSNKSIRLIISVTLNAIIILAGVYIIFTAGNKAYTFGHSIFNEESVTTQENAREVEVTITSADTSKEIAAILYNKGLVKDKTIAYLQIVLSDYRDEFQAGTYTLDTSMKPSDMFAIMCGTQEE